MTEKEAADLHNKFIDEVGFGSRATHMFAQAIRAAALEEVRHAVINRDDLMLPEEAIDALIAQDGSSKDKGNG